MVARHRLLLSGLLLAALATAGCSKREGAIDGFEQWRFGKTTKKDGIACVARDNGLTFCSNNATLRVADHRWEIDLYFRGHEDDAPLVEIIASIGACRVDVIEKALTEKLGKANEKLAGGMFWNGEKAVILARLPADDRTCLVHFVIPEDKERIASLRKRVAEPVEK